MSYIVPIVDRVLREGSGKGVRAIVVYPMNALANSQRGELEKFLGNEKPKVRFARYTGQESTMSETSSWQSPPDILLTNYVMLELMLTRPKERGSLINSAANLSFLVLDELHTYRGRQGADVAMLIRRLRAAIGSTKLQCVGTSATLAGPGTRAEQRAEVAGLASRLFGTAIPAQNIVGESLRRATAGDTDRPASPGPGCNIACQRHTLRFGPMIWPYGSSSTFGLREDDEGKLARQSPTRLRDAAGPARFRPRAEPPILRAGDCATLLLAGSRARDSRGQGRCSRSSCTSSSARETPPTSRSSRPGEPLPDDALPAKLTRGTAGQPLFPLAFCRECGQDYLVVNRESGGERFTPRILNGRRWRR